MRLKSARQLVATLVFILHRTSSLSLPLHGCVASLSRQDSSNAQLSSKLFVQALIFLSAPLWSNIRSSCYLSIASVVEHLLFQVLSSCRLRRRASFVQAFIFLLAGGDELPRSSQQTSPRTPCTSPHSYCRLSSSRRSNSPLTDIAKYSRLAWSSRNTAISVCSSAPSFETK